MNKLEANLTPKQLADFDAVLAETPKLTLRRIVELAADRGVEISVMVAKRYRDGRFAEFLERLRQAKETADAVTAVAEGGQSFSEASASAMSQMVFQRLLADPKQKDAAVDRYSRIIARLRLGDQRNVLLEQRAQKLEAELADYREKEKERLADGEKLKEKLTPEKSPEEVRKIVLDAVDEIVFGRRKKGGNS